MSVIFYIFTGIGMAVAAFVEVPFSGSAVSETVTEAYDEDKACRFFPCRLFGCREGFSSAVS